LLKLDNLVSSALKASFERDCNIPDGTKLEPNRKFKKSWLLKNTGSLEWYENSIELVNLSGNIICARRNYYLSRVKVNETVEVEVEFETPQQPGRFLFGLKCGRGAGGGCKRDCFPIMQIFFPLQVTISVNGYSCARTIRLDRVFGVK
jgi:hypothetical protein